MKGLNYIVKMIFPEAQEHVPTEYERLYQACFEGSEEDVERKLETWDWVHRTTRYN
jgi:hypothetical protein